MAMADGGGRRDTIAAAITAELARQAQSSPTDVDIDALADAIDTALEPPVPAHEGKHPDELNATNDD
ncbi:hypothetical protein [Devosia sp. SL43]|uniref:hypothetical protein n=1 Tax=Devosia sp. SL43 TaxID=2806348 RepID=UPI001F19FE63|nr:hypothetical protein [Devosia sp. SL43]UJW84693.1 hypothetical protein IM737_14855 [Devosia sp. SL43]